MGQPSGCHTNTKRNQTRRFGGIERKNGYEKINLRNSGRCRCRQRNWNVCQPVGKIGGCSDRGSGGIDCSARTGKQSARATGGSHTRNSYAAQPVPADTGDSKPAAVASAIATGAKEIDPAVKQAIDSLLSKQLTHEQRRDILKQLVQSGKIDEAISELQQQAANDPNNAELQTALGQAYIEQAAAMKDFSPDKGILVMQAMKSFDAALNDDSANWEARFTRTAVMSHYPAEMNKGQEVIDQFTQLINQQEAQPPQSQFAKTYVALGDQYQKLGQNDYAQATWQAGAQLFPGDKTLQKRLSGQ